MSETPETHEAVERWRQGKINIFDEMARLEQERNEALSKAESIHQDRLKVVVERDQWRDMATKLFEQLKQWGCQTPECFCECAVVIREFKQINKEGV